MRGLYRVHMDGCPGRLIDTGLPAGEAAQAVARDRYLRWLQLRDRPGQKVEVVLES